VHYHIPAGATLSVIPTVTALALHHFRHTVDGDADIQPKDPAVRFLLGAWNDGDLEEAHEHIAPDCEIYANGLALEGEHAGPAMITQAIESWRAIVPDLTMELTQEIADKHRIAVEFRITGTEPGPASESEAAGGAIDVDGSAFLTVEHGKISEIWTIFDSLALAVQTGRVKAPPGWPGQAGG
jgi:predicted ester cyclase